MLKTLLGLVLLVFTSLHAEVVNIAVAANMSYAIEDIKTEFHKLHPDTQLRTTIGGSGKLATQINNGAPYDIFLSANMAYPQFLYKHKKAITQPRIYAQGALVLLSSKRVDILKNLVLLQSPKIKTIAIANPKTAPYGKASVEALKHAGVYADVKHKFVYGESISQTLTYALRAADIGIVAKSSLMNKKMQRYKQGINWVDIDTKLYTPIKQGIVLLNKAKGNDSAQEFYNFIFSKKAQNILKHYGYLIR